MFAAITRRFAGLFAARAMLVRAGIVGGNFVIMLGLAAWLGLDGYGRLAVLWGLAMVAATILSLGAPLILLRDLSDGRGLTPFALCRQILIYPALLGLAAVALLPFLISQVPWLPVILTGFAFHVLTCMASVLRALEDVHRSMFLRDGIPQCALGLAGVSGLGTPEIVALAAGIMAFAALLALGACLRHPHMARIVSPAGSAGQISPALWGVGVLGMIAAQLDIIVGGALLTGDQIGLYALLRRIANLVALPVSVATWVSATPVSAAFGAGDAAALRKASVAGSRIAMLPGLALFICALALLPALHLIGGPVRSGEAQLIALVLLCGALIQVFLASGFTVATLCGCERLAFLARIVSLTTYLGIVGTIGVALSPTVNALAYVIGVGVGGGLLWVLLRARLGIDTSAAVLWAGQRGQRWRLP